MRVVSNLVDEILTLRDSIAGLQMGLYRLILVGEQFRVFDESGDEMARFESDLYAEDIVCSLRRACRNPEDTEEVDLYSAAAEIEELRQTLQRCRSGEDV